MSVSTADATTAGPVLQTDAGNATQSAAGNESANQSGSEPESDSGSPLDGDGAPAGTTGTGNGIANTGSGGDDDGDGGLFSVESQMDDIMSWFMSAASEESAAAYETLMGELNQLLYTLPAPGVPDDPWSWYTPDNGWWPDVMGLYWMFGSVSVGVLILAGGASFIVDDPSMSKGYLRLSVIGIFAILTGPLFIGAYLHFFNILSLAVAPSGEEFLQGPENMVQLATGSALFFVLLKIKIGLLIVGLIVLFGQFIFTFASVVTWPFSWAARAVPLAGVNSLGVLLFNVFIYLPLLKLVQAAIMRFMFDLSWGAYNWIGGVLVMAGTIIVIGVVFIFLPWKSGEKLLHAAGVHLGMAAVREKSRNAKDVTIEGASNIKQKWVDSPRGQTSTDASSQPDRSARQRGQGTSTHPSHNPSGTTVTSSSIDRQETVRRRRRSINRRASRSDD